MPRPAILALLALLFLWVPLALGASNDPTAVLQKGLFEEEANHDLKAAMQAYQTVISQFDKDRKLAATAVFRLGECYRKQGQTNEANAQYQRIVSEFADQTPLVSLSRQYLASSGGTSSPAAAATVSDAGRQEQKRLLQEQIKLLEKKAEAQQKMVQNGLANPDTIWTTQFDILQLKRQLAELDAGVPKLSTISVPQAGPTTSEETEEVKRIQAIIRDSPDLINAKLPGSAGGTRLHKAASEGQMVVAQFLLDNGADVDAKDDNGQRPLHLAALGGHRAMVELLLARKAQIEAVDGSHKTALHDAAGKGFLNLVEALLARGADINAKDKRQSTPLHLAVENGFRAVSQFLLEHGAQVNAANDSAATPLHRAVARNDHAMADLLLRGKADPNLGAQDGQNPLDMAAGAGDISMATLLIKARAKVNAANPLEAQIGWTPLVYAVNAKQKDMVALLLTNGANPNARFGMWNGSPPAHMDKQWTPLMLAAANYDLPIVEVLLGAKAEPNLKNEDGDAAIFRALHNRGNQNQEKGDRIVALLLEHGAEVNIRDKDDYTPLIVATRNGEKETVRLLLDHGADPNAQQKETGYSALHFTTAWGIQPNSMAIADMLLAKGADPNLLNKSGQTPLNLLEASRAAPGMPSVPVLPRRLGSAPGTGAVSPAQSMAELLRQHGAVQDMPRLDVIEVRRPTANFSAVVFSKGATNYSRYTLLDLLAVHYGFISANPVPDPDKTKTKRQYSRLSRTLDGSLAFPDLTGITIQRPTPDGKGWTNLPVSAQALLDSHDYSKNVLLQWGDRVVVPEADHPLNVRWPGFSQEERNTFKDCLMRQVAVTIKGQTSNLVLDFGVPDDGNNYGVGRGLEFGVSYAPPQFCLLPALQTSGLLLASSDLSRVKVTRNDPNAGQNFEVVFDCSDPKNAPNFWLRNGDRIEVPER